MFQFPHSTLKKYLRHFFYNNMNMQVMRHKSDLILILIYPWCPLDRNQYCDLPSGSSASYHIEVQLNVDVSKSIGATLLLQIGRVIELSVLNTQINPSLLPIIKVYDLSGFEILKFDCVWFNYLRIIVPQHGTNNSGIRMKYHRLYPILLYGTAQFFLSKDFFRRPISPLCLWID